MNKSEFLKTLEKKIEILPKDYIKDILNDYNEYFEDAILDKKTEENISKELGDINYIASSILSEYFIENPTKVNNLSIFMKILNSISIVCAGSIVITILVPLVFAFFLLYLSFYLLSFSFIIVPLALVIHLILPSLPISFGTDVLGFKVVASFISFVIGIVLFKVLEKGRKKIYATLITFLGKNIKIKSKISEKRA